MEIDPKKMDFEKIKSEGKLRDNMDSRQANNVDGMNSGAKNNSAPFPVSPTSTPNSNQPAVFLKKPTELLSEAWKMYKARWKTLLGITVAPILLIIPAVIILGIMLWSLGLINTFENASFGGGLGDSPISFITFLILFILFFSVIIIAQIWSQVALIYAIKNNGDIGIKESYQKSKSKIKSFFWVSVLVGFITMGGFIFFAVPGFIFTVWFSFAIFIVVTENLKGMDAILKSREYVRGYWWSVLWRFLFMYIVLFGVMIAASIILMLIPILGNLVSIALTPLIMVYMFLIYDNLRKIKGGFEFQPFAKTKKLFIAVGVLGAITIPLIFISIGLAGLNSAKDKATDAARYSALTQIKTELSIYYDDNEEYPESLSELNVGLTDPETKESYEYHQLDSGEDYEICAQFKEKGRQCFSLEDDISNIYNSFDRFDEFDTHEEDDEKEIPKNDIKSRDKQRVSDLYSISKMLKRYKTENGIYPISRTAISLSKGSSVAGKIQSVVNDKSIPIDPKDPEYYYSYKSVDGEGFELTARLENLDDHSCDFEIKRKSGICIYKLQY